MNRMGRFHSIKTHTDSLQYSQNQNTQNLEQIICFYPIHTLIKLGWTAIRTILAPDKLGNSESWNCSETFQGI